MRKAIPLILLLVISVFISVSAYKEIPRYDTQVTENGGTYVYYAEEYNQILSRSPAQNSRGVMLFNLSNLSLTTFSEVNLSIYTLSNTVVSGYQLGFRGYYCNDDYWNQTNMTWTNQWTWITNCNSTYLLFNVSYSLVPNNTRYTINSTTLKQFMDNDTDKIFTIYLDLRPFNYSSSLSMIQYYNIENDTLYQPYLEFNAGDLTPPQLNLSYPVNDSRMNNYNGSIVLFSNETISCVSNDTNWSLYASNGTHQTWNRASTPDGHYRVNISCTDIGASRSDLIVNFSIDTEVPQIVYYYPLNNTISNASSHTVNVSVFDNNGLWIVNITITDQYHNVMYQHISGNLSLYSDVQWYNYSEVINTTAWIDGQYNMTITVTDSHTDELINVDVLPLQSYDMEHDREVIQLTDTTDNTDLGEIAFIHPNTEKYEFDIQADRISWTISDTEEYKDINPIEGENDYIRSYYMISAPNLIYLPNSKYDCHMISNDKYWIDCEGLYDPDIEMINDENAR